MKAALLIAGYLRTFDLNIQSLKSKIISKFDDVDIFLHITLNESKEDKYENHINPEKIEIIKSILKPLVVIEEGNYNYSKDRIENNIFNHWNKFYKLNVLKKEQERLSGDYDVVIKYRPDMNIISDIDFKCKKNHIYIPIDSKIDKSKLRNTNDGYICDIFAYGDTNVMNQYFEIREKISLLFDEYGNVPETLLYNHLKMNSINYITSDIQFNIILSKFNTFAICGDSGSGKTTLANYLSNIFENSFLLECDRYHRWERDDSNWKLYSHLNPEANYISKMNQDIFDLKIGKKIYQVDYDHKSGRFTDRKEIDSANNLIVCGLHSLYSNNDAVYDLKIFMDTDKNLKYSWKTKRDILKRGYTIEKVTEQIKSREIDYEKYIEPQKDMSDIIINFNTDDNFEVTDINKELKVKLSIYISKKIDITNIINLFIRNDVHFEYEDLKHINKISFNEYRYNKVCDLVGSNSFYDYIVLVIMNIKTKI